jgi:hypothetical protein
MKKQSSTKIFSIMLAGSSWLVQQTWAQNPRAQALPAGGQTQDDSQVSAATSQQQDNAPTVNPSAGSQAPGVAQSQTQPARVPAGGTTVNPSQAPLQPVTSYPDASGADQRTQPDSGTPAQSTGTLPNAPRPQNQPGEPQGAATAEKVPTAGGAAAKPAGVAIAPAKQHRTRSLLIKIGAVAAAGVAAGTVYALSRGTSSTPPGANSPGAVKK